MGMDERNVLQCEGGNARCIALSHLPANQSILKKGDLKIA
jgi:hypothetical protein